MGYVSLTAQPFFTTVDATTAGKQIEAFCKAAFPGTRPYGYSGRVSVTVKLGDSATASLNINVRALRANEIPADRPEVVSRVDVSGYLNGYGVTTDAAGKAECQRFIDLVAAEVQRALESFASRGVISRPRVRLPRFGGKGLT